MVAEIAPAASRYSWESWAWLDAVDWTKPEYSRSQVNYAGRQVAEGLRSLRSGQMRRAKEIRFADEDAYDIVENWRAAHARPLHTFQGILRRRTKKVNPEGIVVQRMKRFTSIIKKLERDDRARLATMQDIGGCRAVVGSVDEVYDLLGAFNRGASPHSVDAPRDYIAQPKADGYRGIHLVCRFGSRRGDLQPYSGMRVELQLRSQLQHAWATSVEVVDAFEGTDLKSGRGPENWTRFFALMGTVIALKEGCPPVPGTQAASDRLAAHLKISDMQLNAIAKLQTYGTATAIPRLVDRPDAHTWLIVTEPSMPPSVTMKSFNSLQMREAIESLFEAEDRNRGNPRAHVLLASADSLAALKAGFPNYFANTTVFRELVLEAMGESGL